jgi:hypothetical protein
MGDIGYQDGIEAFEQWFRKLSVFIDKWNAYCDLSDAQRLVVDPPKAPRIPLEGPHYDPNDQTTWPWPKKFFDNTMRTLKDDHDAANPNPGNGGNGGNGGEEPVDPKTIFFPRTFNKEGASDARFCVSTSSPAFARQEGNRIFDKGGGVYNSDGLCDGGRDPDFIARKLDGTPLRGAKSMDNFGPCDLYDGLTEWPPDSYHQ